MNILRIIFIVLLALLMLMGGYGHLFTPEISDGFMADFLPKTLIHYGAAVVEIGLGIAALVPKTRAWGLKGIFYLMIAFLPLHIFDLFRENPVLGSINGALIRLAIQFVVIYIAWWVQKPKALNLTS